MLEQLRFGVSAVTADGRDVGTLYRAVIAVTPEGRSHAHPYIVTAVTVQRPLLGSGNLLKPGGWDKPRDLVVSMAHVTGADGDEIRLSLTEDEFLSLPPYITAEFNDASEWDLPPRFIAEDTAFRASALLGGSVYQPRRDDVENRTAGEHHLSHETPVWQREPHTHIGDLDRLFLDDTSNGLTSLVIRRGALFKHEVVISASYIAELFDDLIHVDIAQSELTNLQEFRETNPS